MRLIKISANDEISSVAKVAAEEKEEDADTTALLGEVGEGSVENTLLPTAAALVDDLDDADEDDVEDADDDLDEDDDESESDNDIELA